MLNPKREPFLFFLLVLFHLIPLSFSGPFATLDGPAHLYNSNLIRQLFFSPDSPASQFYEFSGFPQPNWTGHFLLSIFLIFFPAITAEKILLALIILSGAYGFRKLVLKVNPENYWMTWSYFPFIYNFTFCLGFYNFSIGAALLPWIILYWINCNQKNHFHGIRTVIELFILFCILYFSHLVIFLIAGFILGMISLIRFKKDIKKLKVYLGIITFSSLPWLIMTFLFIFKNGLTGYRGETEYLPLSEIISQLLNARMVIVYHYDNEKIAGTIFTIACFVVTVFFGKQIFNRRNFVAIIVWVFMLMLVFVMPDSLASGGILTVRLVMLFYLSWVFLMAVSVRQRTIQKVFAFVSIIISCGLIIKHHPVRRQLSNDAKLYIEMADKIPENAVLLPLNYSTNWLHANFASYTGAVKDILVFDNYEATYRNFPLIWKKFKNPEEVFGTFTSAASPCITIEEGEMKTGYKISHISTLNFPVELTDSCMKDNAMLLNNKFREKVFGKNSLQLFKRTN